MYVQIRAIIDWLAGFHNHKYFTQFLFYGTVGPLFVLATTIPFIISYFSVRVILLRRLIKIFLLTLAGFSVVLCTGLSARFNLFNSYIILFLIRDWRLCVLVLVQPGSANSVFVLASGEASFYPIPFRPIALMVMAVLVASCCLSCLMMFATVLPGILTNRTAVEDAQVLPNANSYSYPDPYSYIDLRLVLLLTTESFLELLSPPASRFDVKLNILILLTRILMMKLLVPSQKSAMFFVRSVFFACLWKWLGAIACFMYVLGIFFTMMVLTHWVIE